jgi:sugar lactone lactonase YvrE
MSVPLLRLFRWRTLASSLLVSALAACGGSGGAPPPPPPPPVITVQPADTTAQDGAPASFAVTATGSDLHYQWRKGGIDVPGANAATFVTVASYADNGASYSVIVSNAGGFVSSNAATLTVTPIAVTITAQPQSASILDGGVVMLSVAANGTPPLAYQWRRGDTNIAGANGSAYTSPALTVADDGAAFSVVVSNPAGGVASANAVVSVAPAPPAIVQSPQAVVTSDGGTVQFAVAATGTAPLAYQWRRNGMAIGGANAPTYTFAAAFGDSGAAYSVVVGNVAGSATSSDAVLTVNPLAPSIMQQPQPATVAPGATASFSAAATGTPPIAWQWQRSADQGATWANIAGATTPTLVFTASFSDFDTRYRAAVTNAAATVHTLAATLQVRADLKLLAGALGGGGYLDGSGAEVRIGTGGYGVAANPAGDVFFNDFSMIRRVSGAQVSTFVGRFNTGGFADGIGTAARLTWPFALASDGAGNLYTTDIAMIRKVTPAGVTTTLAGAYFQPGTADGPVASARFGAAMYGIAVDAAGNVFVSDTENHTIRVISPAGAVSTLAGRAEQAGSADGTGTDARFNSPRGIALDAAGNVVVADSGNHTIRRVTPAGVVTTLAGGAGAPGLANAVGTDARFTGPHGVALDPAQNVYVADAGNSVIRRIAPDGTVITLAGGSPRGHADGDGALARFRNPFSIAWAAASGDLVVGDTFNFTLRRVSLLGSVTTIAGTPPGTGTADGAPGIGRLDGPTRMARGPDGTIFIADRQNFAVRALSPAGTLTTLAGLPGVPGVDDGTGSAARFLSVNGIAVDASGVVYVTDEQVVRRIDPGGAVTTLAGARGQFGADDGFGANARFFVLDDIAVDSAGVLYVADSNNHTIRRITPAGLVTTLAGGAGASGAADGFGPAARFNLPSGLAVDDSGNVYVADSGNHAIRRITPAGDVSTYAGGLSAPGYNDDRAPLARFTAPHDLAFDATGNLYVTDYGNSVVRRVSVAGRVDTIIGEVDRRSVRLGQAALVNQPQGIVVLPGARLVISSENAILSD